MIDARLPLAVDAGLTLPQDVSVVVFGPSSASVLPGLIPDRTTVVHPVKMDHDAWARRGFSAAPAAVAGATYRAALVVLPRAKAEARAIVAAAAAQTDGPLIIDGQKTDGIDSMLKAVRLMQDVDGVISKAHGKLFWINHAAAEVFEDWAAGPALTPGGFWTAPGVFSADGIDPASALLVEVLPEDLSGGVVDLGAGWGFLSAHILVREGVTALYAVEAHHMALACAEHNVTDPRATFHWADATQWQPPEPVQAVIMNPPFHAARSADPTLGKAFITAAARMLAPGGTLWMVANRHLPYEATLETHFSKIVDLGGDARFKLVMAERPKRAKR